MFHFPKHKIQQTRSQLENIFLVTGEHNFLLWILITSRPLLKTGHNTQTKKQLECNNFRQQPSKIFIVARSKSMLNKIK